MAGPRFVAETAADLAIFAVGMTGLLVLGAVATGVGLGLKATTGLATQLLMVGEDLVPA